MTGKDFGSLDAYEKKKNMIRVSKRHFYGVYMDGFELRIWRRGMNWDQERAAEELGVSLRTYKRYEKADNVPG